MAVKSRKTTVVLLLAGAATVGAGDVWQTSVSAGRSESARAAVVEDLDAPVATARYREPSAQALADAGLAPAPVSAPTDVIRLDVPAAAPDDPMLREMARLAEPVRLKVQAVLANPSAGPGFQAPDPDALAALSLADDGRAARRAEPQGRSLGDDAKALLVKVGPSKADVGRGRWFLFAAASGKAFGLNMVKDSEVGLRRAGWSVERLAEWGKGQVGLGWRKGGLQVSMAVAERQIGPLRLHIKDTVGGLTLSWRPHDARP